VKIVRLHKKVEVQINMRTIQNFLICHMVIIFVQ